MTKLSKNFEVPSESMPDAFGVSDERAHELIEIISQSTFEVVNKHADLEDTTMDHVISDIMRGVDSKVDLTEGEQNMLLIQLGSNLPPIRDFIGNKRGMRMQQEEGESEMSKEEVEKLRKLHGRMFRMLANMLDPQEHKFSNN
jgi:hypothetical protein